ncbi:MULTISPECIES: FMN-binding protein [unclassified Clostridium]|uniref:FMN-binding protein n=1 Tax=unclassified Clostridium TaxID=2614128 RepID=UPI00189841AD|nr:MULTISPECIES: FMN-binding protein [unclassified Clostridium]MCR1951717.1 FMN-binding protein [Clostridium sp. DSM 100503]
MKSRRVISLLAVAALATTVFVGCGNKEEAKESGLKDGNYSAKGEKDERGYQASIEIEVKDGKIATVKYDEVGEKGSKLDDAEYNTNMKAKSGTNPEEAFPKLQDALVEKQDVASIDVVTGATKTTDSFKTLAEKALSDAK